MDYKDVRVPQITKAFDDRAQASTIEPMPQDFLFRTVERGNFVSQICEVLAEISHPVYRTLGVLRTVGEKQNSHLKHRA